jgi:glycerol-3-phosphate dehydrogenase (NAD(P)+)
MGQIGVLGAGAWGTALALVAARAGASVTLWAREPEVVASIQSARENTKFLPGITLPQSIKVTGSAIDLAGSDAILMVVPAQFARRVLEPMRSALSAGTPVVLCAKGIEQRTNKLMTDLLVEALPNATPAVLSGPSFAADVARGLPTAVTLAVSDQTLGAELVAALGLPTFRPYLSDDLIGAELGGAVKNVLAIACGIADGKKLGDSARAALITRGFAELARLGLARGAKLETLAGLSGLGDLVLTCSSKQSRNFSLGRALGEGVTAKDALSGKSSVAEGADTAPAVVALAKSLAVEMPICEAVTNVLSGALSVDDAIGSLLSRPFKSEM